MRASTEKDLRRTELLIAYVLRYGVLLCLTVIGAGLGLRFFSSHGSTEGMETLRTLRQGGSVSYDPPVGLAALARGLAAHDADTLIALGLMLLIGLPITRVGLTTLLFLRDRDWVFFAITLFVFLVLMVGIFFGKTL